MKSIIGVDVGGANLKFSTREGHCSQRPFAMWRTPSELASAILGCLDEMPPSDALAVTMTGELADCFLDRGVGVSHIVEHLTRVADRRSAELAFYGVDGKFHNAQVATATPDVVASANWHALGSYVAAEIAADALLIDVGSTTSDVVPLSNGTVVTTARTDHERLCEGTLVYVGCRRTPVCSLLAKLRYRGMSCRVMNEVFATIDDALLVLGACPSNPDDCDTTDGYPRTIPFAANRLARMVGLDRRQVSVESAVEMAEQIRHAASAMICETIAEVEVRYAPTFCQTKGTPLPRPWVLSGHGQNLVTLPDGQRSINLAHRLGPEVSRCATAFAVAQLLSRADTDKPLLRGAIP